jgi:hypothetical protein
MEGGLASWWRGATTAASGMSRQHGRCRAALQAGELDVDELCEAYEIVGIHVTVAQVGRRAGHASCACNRRAAVWQGGQLHMPWVLRPEMHGQRRM